MKKLVFITSLFCIVSVSFYNAQGQSVNKGFFGTLEARYMQGFHPNDEELPWKPYGKSLRLMVGVVSIWSFHYLSKAIIQSVDISGG